MQSCQLELVEFLESFLKTFSFKPMRFRPRGGGRIFPSSPEAEQIRWGGGSSTVFRHLRKPTRFGGGGGRSVNQCTDVMDLSS